MLNGIPIIPFYGEKEDQELLALFDYLKLFLSQDIRECNKKTFKFQEFIHYSESDDTIYKLYKN